MVVVVVFCCHSGWRLLKVNWFVVDVWLEVMIRDEIGSYEAQTLTRTPRHDTDTATPLT
ncbi:hypothetical protein A2U01_0052114 [Trifolium medium]|uniref:Uncharacterized protein n=1 Tax=Trifolium medium TaxID=97028 RepID=A0A392R2W8_9FABA|nr:hypothetical protein [Trifolium medium]